MRMQTLETRRENEGKHKLEASRTLCFNSDEDEGQNPEDRDPQFVHSSTPKTPKTVTLQLPKKPLSSVKISTMADKLNLSAGQRTAFMGAVLAESGV